MKIEKEVPTMTTVDIICDICGNSCKDKEDMNLEYAEIHVPDGWGFYSQKDGEDHTCHMCENCYDKVRMFIENDLGGKIQISMDEY